MEIGEDQRITLILEDGQELNCDTSQLNIQVMRDKARERPAFVWGVVFGIALANVVWMVA